MCLISNQKVIDYSFKMSIFAPVSMSFRKVIIVPFKVFVMTESMASFGSISGFPVL